MIRGGRNWLNPKIRADNEFRLRLNAQYRETEGSVGKASKGRALSGVEFEKRKAELEGRGLPLSKPAPVLPSYRGKKKTVQKRQYILGPG